MDKNLQEKIKLSEKLTDQYIDEVGVMAVNTALNAVNTVQGVSHDVLRLKQWAQKKIELRKRKKEKEKKEKEKRRVSKKRKKGFLNKIKW
jgi:hypothetical protein